MVRTALYLLGSLLSAGLCFANPIYVINEADGVIRFTTQAPAPGVKAEVFTGRSGHYSILSGGRSRLGGKLFVDRYNDEILRAASTYNVEASLVKAVIHAESAFNPRAVSNKGAKGLMQLMPDTARMHGVYRLFEPTENIQAGTRHLAMLMRKYNGNLTNVLAAYNAGEGAVDQFRGVPPFAETQDYVRKVQALRLRYQTAKAGTQTVRARG